MQVQKKNRKCAEFWRSVGDTVGHTCEETEKLFKNLNAEYRNLIQQLHISGIETTESALRNSTELFRVYEESYWLFYPKGGSVVPDAQVHPERI